MSPSRRARHKVAWPEKAHGPLLCSYLAPAQLPRILHGTAVGNQIRPPVAFVTDTVPGFAHDEMTVCAGYWKVGIVWGNFGSLEFWAVGSEVTIV
jgi:hypothetical protein